MQNPDYSQQYQQPQQNNYFYSQQPQYQAVPQQPQYQAAPQQQQFQQPPQQVYYAPQPGQYDPAAPIIVYEAPDVTRKCLREKNEIEENKGWRDLPFFIMFLLHLVLFGGVFIAACIMYAKNGHQEGAIFSFSASEAEKFAILIAGACGVALLISIGWLMLVRKFPYAMIVLGILANCVYFVAMAILMFAYANYIAGAIFAIFALIFPLLFFFWRHRIAFAKEILSATIDVLQDYPATLHVGYMGTFVAILWGILWVATLTAIQAFSGAIMWWLLVFLVFSYYWTQQVINNIVHVTVSGLFATVYFLKGSSEIGMPRNPTLKSFKRATTTSIGSICLGSLLVALLQTLRTGAQAMANSRDGVLVIIGIIANCILACIQSLVEYFNVYAFTQVAIYGKTFCQAAKATWKLIKSHGVDAIINDNLIGALLGMSMLAAGLLMGIITGVVGYYALEEGNWILCAVIGFLIGFCALGAAAEVINSGVCTLFVCFAQEPQTLRTNNPHLYEKFRASYGSRCTGLFVDA